VKKSENKIYTNDGNLDVLNLITGSGCNILDVGCGSGSIAARLKNKGHFVDGVTLSEEELNIAKQYLRNGFIYNLENGLPSELKENEYDYIVCSHVLEHIAYPEKVLTDIKKVLKKDGKLIVALPNVFYYKARFQLLKGSFKQEESGIWDYTHLRWYSFTTASALLRNHNFELEVATVTGDLPAASVLRKLIPERTRKKMFSMLAMTSKGFWGYQLLYRAKNTKP
jgi:2-polyprenyl-3-methyl-5-hydroxy-6-metoxy-1,4-benzoquinol methylase